MMLGIAGETHERPSILRQVVINPHCLLVAILCVKGASSEVVAPGRVNEVRRRQREYLQKHFTVLSNFAGRKHISRKGLTRIRIRHKTGHVQVPPPGYLPGRIRCAEFGIQQFAKVTRPHSLRRNRRQLCSRIGKLMARRFRADTCPTSGSRRSSWRRRWPARRGTRQGWSRSARSAPR